MRKFAQRLSNARKFIQELRAESGCAKICPRENFRFYNFFYIEMREILYNYYAQRAGAQKFVRAKIYTNKVADLAKSF